jgi:hypothetical protein
VGSGHHGAGGQPVRGRRLHRPTRFPAGLPAEPAVDAVHVEDLSSEHLSGRKSLHFDPSSARR